MPRGSRKSSKSSGNTVDKEVANLFKMGANVDQTTLVRLRHKYGDDELVEKIRTVFSHRHNQIVKSAKRFADAVRRKYGNTNTPYHMLLQKARLHARKYKMSDAEFSEFTRMFEQELSGTADRRREVVVPVTNMMKVLGNLAENKDDVNFNLQSGDYKALQQVLNLHTSSKSIHSQMVLQSLTYGNQHNPAPGKTTTAVGSDSSISAEALTVRYDKNEDNKTEHVHPIVAALFLRKNTDLDNHFLLSSISGVVKARFNKEALTTLADYELFYDLVTDPNDIVCDNASTVADLLHRSNLQNQLWNNVLNLRNGRCYNSSFPDFLTSVDMCRLNKYDNPDFVYGRHDGTILKRLLSAFSYRPTVVSTLPVYNQVFAANPYHVNTRPTVTRIPMITIRTAHGNLQGDKPAVRNNADKDTIDIRSVLSEPQDQYFIEGNVVTKRKVSVLYSRGNVFVYLDRRGTQVRLNNYPNMNWHTIPLGANGFEKINNNKVIVPLSTDVNSATYGTAPTPELYTIGQAGAGEQDRFYVNSVVCAKVQSVRTKRYAGTTPTDSIVVGSEAYISLEGVDLTRSSADRFGSNPGNLPTGNYPSPGDATAAYPSAGTLPVQTANNKWVKYDPMEPNASPASGNSPYMSATVKNVEDAVGERGLVVMFSAINQDQNSQVTRRAV